MYNVAKTKQEFWTAFGQYMLPVSSAEGNKISWINYKTGIRHINFKLDVEKGFTSIAIELRHQDTMLQKKYFDQLMPFKSLLAKIVDEEWTWELLIPDPQGKLYSRIYMQLTGVSIFDHNDWPEIISFLKRRIISLDQFWTEVKDSLV